MPSITPEEIGIDTNPAQSIVTGHDLRTYKYTTEGTVEGIEYGMMDYKEENVEFLLSLFGTSDDMPSSFNYYNFVIQDFVSPRVSNHDLSESTRNYSLEFQYNYYMPQYESLASQVHESALPSHYVLKHNNKMMSNLSYAPAPYGDDVNEEAAFSLASLNSTINSYLYTINSSADMYLDLSGFGFIDSETNYYYNYVRNAEGYMQSDEYNEFKDKTRFCFMSFPRSSERSNAPMYSRMRVNYKKSKSPAGTMAETANNLFRSAVSYSRPYIYYFYHHLNSTNPVEVPLNTANRSYKVGSIFNEYGFNPLEVEEDTVTTPLKIYSKLNEDTYGSAPDAFLGYSEMPLFGKMEYSSQVALQHDALHFLDTLFPNIETSDPRVKQLFEGLRWDITKPGLGKFIEGNPSYVPTIICFKIEKFAGTSNVPIQTYYLDHDWEEQTAMDYSFFEFLDTQLAYGVKYTYKVSAVCRIETPIVQVIDAYYVDEGGKIKRFYKDSVPQNQLGSNQSQSVLQEWMNRAHALGLTWDNMMNKIFIKTRTTTKAEFLEIEIIDDSIDSIEPIFEQPEPKFYNQNGKQNDLLVRGELNYNGTPQPYIPITPEDQQLIDPYLQYFNTNGTYDFVTMNGPARFEIRRLSNPPDKYTDFANASVATFSSLASTEAYMVDKILPNKKYYYIMRTINNHGVFSNPTPVFQIELLQDSDDTFIIVEEYKFKNNLTNNYSKSGKRYFQLKVSNLQGLINEQDHQFTTATTATEVRDAKLGPENLRNNIWGKTFKIRLTSEKTGKKIDFNVSFKHTDEPS